MRAILTGAIAAIEAAAVALATLLIVGAFAFLVWWLSFDLAAEPRDVLAAIGGAWLLAHFVPLTISLSAETMQLLGFGPQELSFTLSLVPLGLTLITIAFAARSGWRFGNRGGSGVAGVIGGALGFAAAAVAVAAFARASATPPWLTGLIAAGLYGAASAVAFVGRAARDDHDWWRALLERVERVLASARVPHPASVQAGAGEALRLAGMLVAAYIGLAGAGFALAVVLGYADVIAASQALQLNVWGAVMMFVLQLALLPLFVAWSGAWLTGAGFSIGLASSASPFGALLGPLPGVPVLAAIPDGWGIVAILAPVLLVLAGVAVGVLLGDAGRRHGVPGLFAVVLLAAGLAGLVVALLSWAAGGSLGPGRLEVVGSGVWITAGLAAAELGVGCLLGALAARADLGRRAASAVPIHRRDAVLSLVEPDELVVDPDDQLTQPIEPLERLAPVVHLRPLDEFARPALQVDPETPPEPAPDPDPEPMPVLEAEPESEPARPVREPLLFDQHDEQQTVEIEPLAATAAPERPQSPLPVDPRTTDPDALVEAYSWDRAYGVRPAEPGEAPGSGSGGDPEPGSKPGWRWPRRKG